MRENVAVLDQAGLVDGALPLLLTDGGYPGFGDLRALAASQPETAGRNRLRGASMLYSSGTTGRPKGVKVALAEVPPEVPPPRHAGLLRNYGLGADTVFVTAAPFYHAGPLRIAMAVMRAGGTVIAFRAFDAAAVLAAIDKFRVTHGFFVPTMFQRMLDLPAAVRGQFDLRSMRHAMHGAAPCPPHVKRGDDRLVGTGDRRVVWWH